jgi:hypothetical protein
MDVFQRCWHADSESPPALAKECERIRGRSAKCIRKNFEYYSPEALEKVRRE